MSRSETQVPSITNLQRYLRQLSYDTSDINAPPVDGIAGEDTRSALQSFQALQGLPVTGRADLATWEALYNAYRRSLADNGMPVQISVFPRSPLGFEMQVGTRGFAVATLQYMLQELELYEPTAEQGFPNGVYDVATAEAVKRLQSRSLLPITGRVDLLTWNSLAEQYNSMLSRRAV